MRIGGRIGFNAAAVARGFAGITSQAVIPVRKDTFRGPWFDGPFERKLETGGRSPLSTRSSVPRAISSGIVCREKPGSIHQGTTRLLHRKRIPVRCNAPPGFRFPG